SEDLPKIRNLLFLHGVDINAVDENNNNALMYANSKIMRKDILLISKYLIERNINIFAINNFGQTIITYIVKNNKATIRTRSNIIENHILNLLKIYISKGV